MKKQIIREKAKEAKAIARKVEFLKK